MKNMNKNNLLKVGGRIKTYATVWMVSYVALCVVYGTASIVGYLKGVQLVVRETKYVQTVNASAVSPLAE